MNFERGYRRFKSSSHIAKRGKLTLYLFVEYSSSSFVYVFCCIHLDMRFNKLALFINVKERFYAGYSNYFL